MTNYYAKINSDKVITDVISYPHEGYVPLNIEELPGLIYGGWHKLIDGELIELTHLKPVDLEADYYPDIFGEELTEEPSE